MYAPTSWEWGFIYLPMAVVLLCACLSELETGKVTNLLTLPALLYFLGMRLAADPREYSLCFSSLLLACLMMIGVAWPRGLVGGGSAKLTIAVCSACHPAATLIINCGMILLVLIAKGTRRWHGIKRLPGSVVLSLMVVLTIGTFALCAKTAPGVPERTADVQQVRATSV